MAKEEKVSDSKIKKLETQKVEKDDAADAADAIDRSLGGIPSKIGQWFLDNW